jgi:biotin carboxyl carrier protein
MYKAYINNQEFGIESEGAKNSINGVSFDADIIEFKKDRFHIIRDNRSYTAEVLHVNTEEKLFTIKVNNAVFQVQVRDKYDELLREMGIDSTAGKKANDLKAPMPGLVLNILVSEGQPVAKGDPILVLEAMKMENIIKAASDGMIKKIAVAKGDKVEKNQVMITMG